MESPTHHSDSVLPSWRPANKKVTSATLVMLNRLVLPLVLACVVCVSAKAPNIVLFLTDDQDVYSGCVSCSRDIQRAHMTCTHVHTHSLTFTLHAHSHTLCHTLMMRLHVYIYVCAIPTHSFSPHTHSPTFSCVLCEGDGHQWSRHRSCWQRKARRERDA